MIATLPSASHAAWLESLDEDWPSSPLSNGELPSNHENLDSPTRDGRDAPLGVSGRTKLESRHSLRNSQHDKAAGSVRFFDANKAKDTAGADLDSDDHVLREESANDSNRRSSILMTNNKSPTFSSRGSQRSFGGSVRRGSRRDSSTSDGSVVRHPGLGEERVGAASSQTPEWKRRLVLGGLQYGEQRDLFSSAANGLQDMFNPPPADSADSADDNDEDIAVSPAAVEPETSPATFEDRRASYDLAEEVSKMEQEECESPGFDRLASPSPSPRRPKRQNASRPGSSHHGHTHSPSLSLAAGRTKAMGPEVRIYRDASCFTASSAGRNVRANKSGYNDSNESFSEIKLGMEKDATGQLQFTPRTLGHHDLTQRLERLRLNQDSALFKENRRSARGFSAGILKHHDDDARTKRGVTIAEDVSELGAGSSANTDQGTTSAPNQSLQFENQSSHFDPNDSNIIMNSTPLSKFTMSCKSRQHPEMENNVDISHGLSPIHYRAPGSPLKLFGPYDTYTNQTLLRRISQFEEGTPYTSSAHEPSDVDEGIEPVKQSAHIRTPARQAHPEMRDSSSPEDFGSGKLDGYKFTTSLRSPMLDQQSSAHKPTGHGLSHGHMRKQVHLTRPGSSSSEGSGIFVRRRRERAETLSSQSNVEFGGKRPRTSPEKVSTPKRRRTHQERTQDFLDEATRIMAAIRNQVHGNESVASESGSESEQEPFSRPPSRGEPLPSRRNVFAEQTPEIAARLRRYKEATSDMDELVSNEPSSPASRELLSPRSQGSGHEQDSYGAYGLPMVPSLADAIISDIPNVRISTNPNTRYSSQSYNSFGSDLHSNGSYRTGSSRGSDTRKTIVPESVSHLIGDRVGSMRLDKGNNVWVKEKGFVQETCTPVPQSDSEDDPFASIPDLSVDAVRELDHLNLASPRKESTLADMEPLRAPDSSTPARPKVTFRPVSRIDEHDEDSTVELPHHQSEVRLPNQQLSLVAEQSLVSHHYPTPDGGHANVSLVLNQTPIHGSGLDRVRHNALSLRREDEAIIGSNVGKLSLSPLSDFTFHHKNDQSFGFEVSYVMGDRHFKTGNDAQPTMSISLRTLVEKLAQAEPQESYWEELTELDLSGMDLASLHQLDEFCPRLVKLDVSQNALSNLDGIPGTVRELKVCGNRLTELTSWDHLPNLQYVDCSQNDLRSLSGLRNLHHLRSIKADKNHLKSINDLDKHAGLLSLRARDNEIEEADFARCQLARVTEVDLEGNSITWARNLHCAPALAHIKLTRNRLCQLEFKSVVPALKHLDISHNQVASIDLTNVPNLTLFHADSNRFGDIRGCDVTRRLDSLSLREQQGEQPIDMSFLTAANEVRKLYLSGNFIGAFAPRVDMLNLQLLELASCGLQFLPDNLGQLMPNLRSVNLNFNSIPDIQCLAFIPRLKKLLVAGNQIKDARVMEELVSMFPHLTQVDTRDNPFTQGFYVPLCSLSSEGRHDPFVLPEADAQKDAAFAGRLIMEMKMRRRVHHIAFAARCKKLRMLDGLEMSTKKALAQDDILRKLMEADIVPLLGGEEN
ncbi:uncharacterized protein F5Z01DRAFT_720181 [Emericellopsis atlantica]|uniref:Septation initiation network scaffold protein cdc11 n=1 Tax=Emericellopsis atlantica TaxID=2614577 RepID=A0A9P7ZQX8_9HYPO|nr:uncharacterized protein F5Z01DRAFT_720181 [Emericellopsis atlantica]KAG9256172.1 hypothetical protein F5Z01DRAFT_720181 [Emericellopsis atlantica]